MSDGLLCRPPAEIPRAVGVKCRKPMSDEKEDDPLEVYWDDVRVARRRAPPPIDDAAARLRAEVESNDMVIGTSRDRLLVVIKPDGRLLFGPEYNPDEAAMAFWEAMGRYRYQFEERVLLIQHMEALLTRLGAADLYLEGLRLRAAEGEEAAGQQAGGGLVALERLVHQTIELGRGLARRPDMPVPDLPQRVPDRIRQNPQSAYEGREGLDPDPDPETPPRGGTLQ